MMAMQLQHRGMRRLLLVALAPAAVAVLGGAYAWWRWGPVVMLEAFTRFCL
jgi:hypothetical protein